MHKLSFLIGFFALLWGGIAQADDAKTPPDRVVQGEVMLVRGLRGGEAQLTDGGKMRWLLKGPLRAELLKLGGHTLKVWAKPTGDEAMTPTLHVMRYQMIRADGKTPLVGTLRLDEQGAALLERATGLVKLRTGKGLAKRLKKRQGCKVWAVGTLQANTLEVVKTGLLSCPPKAKKAPCNCKGSTK